MHRSTSFIVSALLALPSCCAFAQSSAISIPVSGTDVHLETFVYRPTATGPRPVVIFNHGSAGGEPRQSLPSTSVAQYFADQGYIAVVPMRRGRGKSSGTSPESEDKNCDPTSWGPGLQLSFDDLSAVFEHLSRVAGADRSRVILAGASRGGFLSVAYAAAGMHRSSVVGVVNFVGGWVAQAEDNCPIDFNYVSFAAYGRKTKVPMLWLYGANDAFYSAESIESYHTVFAANGGVVRFRLIDGVPDNGHWLPGYKNLWSRSVTSFLSSIAPSVP